MFRTMMAMGVATAICSMSSLVAAQTGGAMKKDAMGKEMMVTGCVAQGVDMNHFMLNNATMAGAMDMKKESMPMGDKPMSYMLMGNNLKAHVGHKVEVTGMMEEKKMDTMSKETMPKDAMGKDMAMGPMLTVKSIKMLSASCS